MTRDDRSNSSELFITHEGVGADATGVRRESVSVAAQVLQAQDYS
jgi:hypothetical protein